MIVLVAAGVAAKILALVIVVAPIDDLENSLKFAKGGAITVVTEVEGYVGEITADGGEDINVFIKQD